MLTMRAADIVGQSPTADIVGLCPTADRRSAMVSNGQQWSAVRRLLTLLGSAQPLTVGQQWSATVSGSAEPNKAEQTREFASRTRTSTSGKGKLKLQLRKLESV